MIRQIIVSKIIEELKNIRIDKGFYTDAGNNVFEWLEKPLEGDEYPAIIVRDPSDSVTDDGVIAVHTLKIEIDIAIKGKNCHWDMREATSDVVKAFANVENELNFLCKYGGSEFITEQKESTYGGVRIEFDVMYQSRRWEQ